MLAVISMRKGFLEEVAFEVGADWQVTFGWHGQRPISGKGDMGPRSDSLCKSLVEQWEQWRENLRRALSARLRLEERLCRQWGATEGSRTEMVTRETWPCGCASWVRGRPWSRKPSGAGNIHARVQGCSCGPQTPTCPKRWPSAAGSRELNIGFSG